MSHALNNAQLQLLRLAQLGDVPLPREQRHQSYFGDVELLVMLNLMEPRGDGFALTQQGATYLERLRRPGEGAAQSR